MHRFNGEALRRLRSAAGLTQEELGLKAPGYVTTSTVSHLETGRTTNPRVETVQRLADALHVDLAVLLDPELYSEHIDAVAQAAKRDRASARRRFLRSMRREEARTRKAEAEPTRRSCR